MGDDVRNIRQYQFVCALDATGPAHCGIVGKMIRRGDDSSDDAGGGAWIVPLDI
jgi:hypothetical protein